MRSENADLTSQASRRRKVPALLLIAVASGFAGLAYETIWARQLSVALGHEIIAVLGVIAALFAGFALGSVMTGARIAASRQPALWYAGLECAIAVWALAAIVLLPAAVDVVPMLLPADATPMRQWFVAFALPFILLLPATFAMGGTLPALDAMLAPLVPSRRAVSLVYTANTFGAVLGTLATTFVLMRFAGLSATLAVCAAVNVFCAIAGWRLASGTQLAANVVPKVRSPATPTTVRLMQLFLTGLLGIGYEVLTIRVVSQVLENTIYTFAILLAAYLLGTAIGAALQRSLARRITKDALTTTLVLATSVSCISGVLALGYSETILDLVRGVLPATMAGRLGAECALAAIAFLPPTIAMGAVFTQLAQDVRDANGNLGKALAVNMLGAAIAPAVFGPILIPLVGAKAGFAVIALAYLLALPNARLRTLAIAAPAAVMVTLVLLSPFSLRFMRTSPGGQVVWHRDGMMAAVSVIQDPNGVRHLQVNNHFRMGGNASVRSDYRQAHVPLLLHPDPKSALFLGLGTGTTLSAAGDHPHLRVDGVELVPEVVESFPFFAKSAPNIGTNDRIQIHTSDARRFVRTGTGTYDVVVADLYHPSVDGTGALYTREHFAAIRNRLADDGLFCQWLPLYQLDLPTLQVIVRTFLDVYPDATAYLAQFSIETPLIGLVGGKGKHRYDPDWMKRRVRDSSLAGQLRALDLADTTALLGLYVANAADLRAFAGVGPINTDDRPIVAVEAPRVAYAAADTPGNQLVALLRKFQPQPNELLGDANAESAERLANYWRARNQFIDVGNRTKSASDARNFIATVAPQLIEVVRVSSDFDAAYMPVLAMARQLGRVDPGGARILLEALADASPSRPEARRLLTQLPPPGRGRAE